MTRDQADECGDDGLTDSERAELAEQYMREAATFTREDYVAAHAKRKEMRS